MGSARDLTAKERKIHWTECSSGMTGKFSVALKLGWLNDFIAPSQPCVISLNGTKKEAKSQAELVQIQAKVQTKVKWTLGSEAGRAST